MTQLVELDVVGLGVRDDSSGCLVLRPRSMVDDISGLSEVSLSRQAPRSPRYRSCVIVYEPHKLLSDVPQQRTDPCLHANAAVPNSPITRRHLERVALWQRDQLGSLVRSEHLRRDRCLLSASRCGSRCV